MSFRSRGEVVPIEVARQIHVERERALAQLQRVQQDSAALRRTLEHREDEHKRLLQTTRALEAELVNARRASPPPKQLPQLEASEQKLRLERDAAVHECSRTRAELEATRARIGELEVAHSAMEARQQDVHESAPDTARVQELLADLANLRRRKEIDLASGIRVEQVRLLGRLGEVRDSVTWALAASPDPKSPWFVGLVGIRDQIDSQLRAEHASLSGEVGDPFDPRVHEAIGTAPGATAGILLRVESPAIRLEDGTIVRPARVVVSS